MNRDTARYVHEALTTQYKARLASPMPGPGRCQVCLGVCEATYAMCYRCNMAPHDSRPRTFGVCTFALKGSQLYRDLRNYKGEQRERAQSAQHLLLCLLYNALITHADTRDDYDAWTVVPSVRATGEGATSKGHPLTIVYGPMVDEG